MGDSQVDYLSMFIDTLQEEARTMNAQLVDMNSQLIWMKDKLEHHQRFAEYVVRYLAQWQGGHTTPTRCLDNIWLALQELHPYIPEVD